MTIKIVRQKFKVYKDPKRMVFILTAKNGEKSTMPYYVAVQIRDVLLQIQEQN